MCGVTCSLNLLGTGVNIPGDEVSAVRSVTLNLANKFSQCTFSVTEHYDLFSGLIILRQASWRRSYDVIRTDRTEPTEKLLQEKLNATTPT